MRIGLWLFASIMIGTGVAAAQQFSTSPCEGHANGGGWFSNAQACELRRTTFAVPGGDILVKADNGAIAVEGQDRNDVVLEARVSAGGRTEADAQRTLHEIEVSTGHVVHAIGPKQGMLNHTSWSVGYKLLVPRRLAVNLESSNGSITASALNSTVEAKTSNGAITVSRVNGNVEAHTTNGALHLSDLGGAVDATTTNGGISISLSPGHRSESVITAESSNGGISLKAPENLRAHLVAETSNGGIAVALPAKLPEHIGHRLDTNLNGGGPEMHLTTSNGGISIGSL